MKSIRSASSKVTDVLSSRLDSSPHRNALEKVPLPEWRALSVYRPNVLIEGSESDNEHTLVALDPDFYPTRYEWSHLPEKPTGDKPFTLIVRDVAKLLSRSDQDALESWLSASPHMQVVCTASTPLFPLVESGVFPERLYYRLNTMRVSEV